MCYSIDKLNFLLFQLFREKTTKSLAPMKTFLCKTCNKKFEAAGVRVDWNDPVYGPCSKYTAQCPCNGEECEEFKPQMSHKEEAVSTCGSGHCSCGR